MANDVTMPTNSPVLNTEYVDGLYSPVWLRFVRRVFSLACKVQQLHVQEDYCANSKLQPCAHTYDTSSRTQSFKVNCVKKLKKIPK